MEHFSADEVFSPPRLARGFIEKSYTKELHTQGFYEINIVLSGKATHYIGERKLTVRAGDTFIIPPLVAHGYEGEQGFDVYHLLLHPKFLERHAASLTLLPSFSALFRVDPLMREKTSAKLHFLLGEDEISGILPALYSIASADTCYTAPHAVVMEGFALTVIARLCDIYAHKNTETEPTNEDVAFANSLSYIYENYDKTVTVEMLCKLARMSRTAYLNKFKRVTGKSPAVFQSEYRVQVAKRLLTESNSPISDIAAAVGFFDTSHFVRIFKKHTAQTPTEWRKMNI